MFVFEPIFEFSRLNCVAICSFLVPANLITTIVTLTLVATESSVSKMRWSRAIASVFAVTLFVHISTWFVVGVITPVTFILFGLGTTCLLVNMLAVIYRTQITEILSTKLLPAIYPNLID
jgi:hypothetical protein